MGWTANDCVQRGECRCPEGAGVVALNLVGRPDDVIDVEAPRLFRWMFGIAVYIGLAYLSIDEWRYWTWGVVGEAKVIHQVRSVSRGVAEVTVTYTFKDPVLGLRREDVVLVDNGRPIGKTIRVRYLPAVPRMSRTAERYLIGPIVLFLAANLWVAWKLYRVIRIANEEAPV